MFNKDMQMNLFGEEVDVSSQSKEILQAKYIIPPFSVFDTKQGYWQDRKRKWIDLGIKSEVGRDDKLTFGDLKKYGETLSRTSIFDPVCCEICYKWYGINHGTILDPFAGGSVRGIVASTLGFKYTGIDLSERQIRANKDNAKEVIGENYTDTITWLNGDSNVVLDSIQDNSQDLVFTCPPYFDLEVYSDDKDDISNMSWDDFKKAYRSILSKAVNKLKDNRFCIIVIGDVRNKNTGEYIGLVNYTKAVLRASGMKEWNEVILLNSIATASVRASQQFNTSRKLAKVHQNILIFYKGDQKKIKEEFKELDLNY